MKIEGSVIANSNYMISTEREIQKKNIVQEGNLAENQISTSENFPKEKQLIEAIEKSNKDLKTFNTSLKFSIHEKTKQIMVKVINNETQEVVREIPPEKILDMVAAMLEKTGLFVDKRG
ncbi:flagellar protein FlaG [Thermotalea metallivorans]|uniref:Flagellar protein FlaG n=1 Tax=Thermotalea metallivorans TaxID=520762 RepID=A0A140L727_9FIRM|nr:flagellar protein FlaG [Thermotalea metallivorans]KXG76352.1 hypothetical protein AN619_13100 [Thermotalea metallivorans]